MATKQCRSCGGVFVDPQGAGARYFHTCPPVEELRDPTGRVLTPAEAALVEAAGGIVTRVAVPRPNARDENVDPAKLAAALDAHGQRRAGLSDDALMKAPGAGVDELPDRDAV